MKDTKFTPGAWTVGLNYEQMPVGFHISDKSGSIILSDDVAPSDEVMFLISAAPDLYNAIEEVLYHLVGEKGAWSGYDEGTGVNVALKALAKARGEK